MFIHKNILYSSLLILSVLTVGCATTYAPDNWLPETDQIPQSNYGGWITIVIDETTDQSEEKWIQYSGEFITVDSEYVYVLYDSLYVLKRDKIINSIIELDQKNTGAYGAWLAGGSLLTISNGLYAGITFPLWMIAGIPAVSGESFRDRYEEENPDEYYWDDVIKYSRFPQGVDGLNLSDLQPIIEKGK